MMADPHQYFNSVKHPSPAENDLTKARDWCTHFDRLYESGNIKQAMGVAYQAMFSDVRIWAKVYIRRSGISDETAQHLAWDLSQDIFLRVWDLLDRGAYAPSGQSREFVLAVARNVLREWGRKEKDSRGREHPFNEIGTQQLLVEDMKDSDGLVSDMRHCIKNLTRKLRAAIRKKAQELQLATRPRKSNTAKDHRKDAAHRQNLKRAREQIKQCLQKRGHRV